MHLTPRERILNTLRRQPNDQVPWNGDLAYWIAYLKAEGMLKPEFDGPTGRVDLHRSLHIGFYLQGHYPFREVFDGGVTVTLEERGNDRIKRYETPVGSLQETRRYSPQTYSRSPVEWLVKTAEDMHVLHYIYEHTHYEPWYDLCETMNGCVGDQGVTLVYTPHTPFMELVTQRMGIENLIYAMEDDEEGFEALFETMKEKFDEAAAIAVAAPAECVMLPENLSSEVVGKQYYTMYMQPIHKKWTAKIREAGKYSFIHMDGTLRGLIAEVARSGFDVLEALTPAPVGDMTLQEMLDAVQPETIVWGGLPGGYCTDELNDEQFDAYVKSVLEIMKTDRRFSLGVADQVCPGARFERLARVQELVDRYGKYD